MSPSLHSQISPSTQKLVASLAAKAGVSMESMKHLRSQTGVHTAFAVSSTCNGDASKKRSIKVPKVARRPNMDDAVNRGGKGKGTGIKVNIAPNNRDDDVEAMNRAASKAKYSGDKREREREMMQLSYLSQPREVSTQPPSLSSSNKKAVIINLRPKQAHSVEIDEAGSSVSAMNLKSDLDQTFDRLLLEVKSRQEELEVSRSRGTLTRERQRELGGEIASRVKELETLEALMKE
jgi:hypothetical protein